MTRFCMISVTYDLQSLDHISKAKRVASRECHSVEQKARTLICKTNRMLLPNAD